MTAPIRLFGPATAAAPHALPQDIVGRRAEELLGPRYPQFQRMLSSFAAAGIDRRQSVVPFEWFDDRRIGWKERNDAYLAGCADLFARSAAAALDAAEWTAAEVDVIVTVSSTGVATPTLEAVCGDALGFRADALRVPVFGLGCAGGATGLTIAAQMARGAPGAKVLLVVVEACTVSFRTDRLQKADVIATVLFGDGGAACAMTAGDGPVTVAPGAQHRWPDTLGIMGWDVDDEGLGVVFDRSIPDFATARWGRRRTRPSRRWGGTGPRWTGSWRIRAGRR
ncbi:type III polyketide synthase [Jannaschia sp. Os4]|uniref:type III polyketide synthase n=1 Tax=Jannaschia sp. Os4 TaxID=2807617 RepID=UPI001EED335C|nr:type III polyketide synthase [Jannaschia sp. Os4]